MIPMKLLMVYGFFALVFLALDAMMTSSDQQSRQRAERRHRDRIHEAAKKYWSRK